MGIAEILQAVAPLAATETLLRAVVLNVLIGNGDAHAKNFSLLHNPPGALGLAPLYDLMSTLYCGDERLAMYVDSVQRIRRVTADRIFNEAARWELGRRRASQIIADIIDRTPNAVSLAAAETPSLPAEIPEIIGNQLEQLRSAFQRDLNPRDIRQHPAEAKRAYSLRQNSTVRALACTGCCLYQANRVPELMAAEAAAPRVERRHMRGCRCQVRRGRMRRGLRQGDRRTCRVGAYAWR